MKYTFLGSPDYIEPYKNEYVVITIERNIQNFIRCSIDGNPTPSYQWVLGNVKNMNKEEIVSDRNNYVITPKENDAPGANRTVTCIAKNNRGTKRQVFTLQLIN